jgi:uncharacterized protein (DUF2267 family)
MSSAGLRAFDSTLQKTNLWLKQVAHELDTDDRQKAYIVLRGVLQTLRDRLTLDEAVELGAQLPMLVRGFYYEDWNLREDRLRERHLEQFLSHVQARFPNGFDVAPEVAVRVVFRLLAEKISEGEMQDVRHLLPSEIRDLMPEIPRQNV